MPAALEGKGPLRSAQWLHNPHQLDPLEPRLYFPVKELPISRVGPGAALGTQGQPVLLLVGHPGKGGASAPQGPGRPGVEPRNCVAPQHPSLPSPPGCSFIHKATSTAPPLPQRPQRAPGEPQPRPLAPGHRGFGSTEREPLSAAAPDPRWAAYQLFGPHPACCWFGVGGRRGAQRLGRGSTPFRFAGGSARGAVW